VEPQYNDKQIPLYRIEAQERIVEVPVNCIEERLVEVPQTQMVELKKEVGREQYQDIPKQIAKVELVVQERVVPVQREFLEEVAVQMPQTMVTNIRSPVVTGTGYGSIRTSSYIPASPVGSIRAPIGGTSVATLGGSYGIASPITSSYTPIPTTYTNVSAINAGMTSYSLGTNYGSALPLATNTLAPSLAGSIKMSVLGGGLPLSGSIKTSVIGGGLTPTYGIGASGYTAPVGLSGYGTSGFTTATFGGTSTYGTTGTSSYGTSGAYQYGIPKANVTGDSASAYYARMSAGQIY